MSRAKMQPLPDSLNTSCVSAHQRPAVAHIATSAHPSMTVPLSLGTAGHYAAGHAPPEPQQPGAPSTQPLGVRGAYSSSSTIVVLGPSSDPHGMSQQPLPHGNHPTAGMTHTAALQRKQILDHVNELLKFCNIPQSKGVTDIRQCSSSFFVLLYQRLFDCTIESIDSSPNTLEKKRRNVSLVLDELRRRRYDLHDISAEEVVRLNEEHISRLILVFASIAGEMSYEQEWAAAATSSGGAVIGGSAEEMLLLGTGVTGPPPLGYTVAEVAANTPSSQGYVPYGGDEFRYEVTRDGETLEDPSSSGYEKKSEEDPYYMDDSAIPTEELVKNWYREIVSPDGSAASTNPHGRFTTPLAAATDGTARRVRHYDISAVIQPRPAGAEEDPAVLTAASQTTSKTRDSPRSSQPHPEAATLSLPKKTQRAAAAAVSAHRRPAQKKPRLFIPRPFSSRLGHSVSSSVGSPPSLSLEEPAFTQLERRLLTGTPYRLVDREARDRKIERLRTARFLSDVQDSIRQRIRHEYDERMSEMRVSLHQHMHRAERELIERRRCLRDEDKRYRDAFTVLMESAARGTRVPPQMMSWHTALYADSCAHSLKENRRMCKYLEREKEYQVKTDVMRDAETISAWMQRALPA